MELNFKQITKIFDFTETYKGDFFIYFTFFNFHFIVFRHADNFTTNKCLFLNKNKIIDNKELFLICNEKQERKKEVEPEPDFLFEKFISEEYIYNFSINLISFSNAENDIKNKDEKEDKPYQHFFNFIIGNNFHLNPNDDFFFYYDFKKCFSLKLTNNTTIRPSDLNSESKNNANHFDFVDFSPNIFNQRFNNPDCFFSTIRQTFNSILISFNPFLFLNYFVENNKFEPYNFKFIVPGILNNKKVINILNDLPPENNDKELLFLTNTIKDGLLSFQFLCIYITMFKGKTVSLSHTFDYFSLEFILVSENIKDYVQLCANIQEPEKGIDVNISEIYSIKFENTKNNFFKILTLKAPVTFSNIKKCFLNIAKFYNLKFNLIIFN